MSEAASPDDDVLTELRAELEAVGRLPLDARMTRFERTHVVVSRELAQLDEL